MSRVSEEMMFVELGTDGDNGALKDSKGTTGVGVPTTSVEDI